MARYTWRTTAAYDSATDCMFHVRSARATSKRETIADALTYLEENPGTHVVVQRMERGRPVVWDSEQEICPECRQPFAVNNPACWHVG